MAFEALEDERKWRRSDPPVVEERAQLRSWPCLRVELRFLMETGEPGIPGSWAKWVEEQGCGSQLAFQLHRTG